MYWIIRGSLWFGLYLLLVLFPLVVAAVSPGLGAGRPFPVQFGVACGYVGLAIMAFEYTLISKVSSVAAAFGQDALLQFHKQMGILAFFLILIHPVALIAYGYPVAWLNPLSISTPWAIRWGVFSATALLCLMVLSIGRKALRLPYDWWQLTHGILADALVLMGLAHLLMVNVFASQRPMRLVLVIFYALLITMGVRFKIIKPLLQWSKPWEIVENREELGHCRTLVLRPVGHQGFVFEPGQFAWLNTGKTPFHKDRHPISISSCAYDAPGSEVAFTIRSLGDWSGQTVPRLERGARLWIDGPYGVFTADRQQGPGYVLIGGGVGITPLYSMCQTFVERGDQRPVVVFFGGRDLESLTFASEFEELHRSGRIRFVPVLEKPSPGWQGETGYVTEDVLKRHLPQKQLKRLQYFICGPTPLMDAMESTLPRLGIPAQQIHTERFDMV